MSYPTTRQIKNILVGVGKLEINDTAGTAFNSADFSDLGYTVDGVEFTLEPDMVDIKVDQLGDAAKLVENQTKAMVKTTLAEATLEALAVAWGYASSNVVTDNVAKTKTFSFGVFQSGIPTERSLRFTGKSPDGLDRVYTCRRVVSAASSAHAYKRSEATLFPIEFRVLPDASQTGAEYGTIVDLLP